MPFDCNWSTRTSSSNKIRYASDERCSDQAVRNKFCSTDNDRSCGSISKIRSNAAWHIVPLANTVVVGCRNPNMYWNKNDWGQAWNSLIDDGDNALGYGIFHSPVVAFGGIKSYGFNNSSSFVDVVTLLLLSFNTTSWLFAPLTAVSFSVHVVGMGVREMTTYSGGELLLLLLLLMVVVVGKWLSLRAVSSYILDDVVVVFGNVIPVVFK